MISWIIKDWAGNIKFNGKKFKSFDDGEEYLCEYFDKNSMDYDEWRGEYYVVEQETE